MSIGLLHRLEKFALFFVILFLPITGLPKRFTLPFLGNTLSMYFLFAGILLVAYEYIKHGTLIRKTFVRYFVIYVLWQLLCVVIGLCSYEYNEYLTIEQSQKLLSVVNYLSLHGLIINELLAIKIWLLVRSLRDILFLNNQVLVLAFLVWHLYHDDWEKGFYDVRKAILSLVIVMGTYSFIELLWLKMQLPYTEELLKTINVFLYDPESAHGWWPPLLWWGQLRSLCHEPPYFSIISIMCLPFIWSYIIENNYRVFSFLLVCYYGLMIAATNARTAIIVTLGQFCLMIMLAIWLKNKDWANQIIAIFLCMGIGFACNLVNIKAAFYNNNFQMTDDVAQYVERNITSVTKKDSRSNSARLANMIANVETIKDFPVFGVGHGLKDAYIDARLPEFSYSNDEVRNWSRYMHNEGVLKSGYPALNKYLDEAVNNGIIGLLMYLVPVLYLFFGFYRLKKKNAIEFKKVMIFVSFVGLLVAQLSNADLIICNGITWGLMLCMVDKDSN